MNGLLAIDKLLALLFFALVAISLNDQRRSVVVDGAGVPLGILLDRSWPQDVKRLAEKTISHINSNIKYGRNKWAYQINTLKLDDSNQFIRTVCNQLSRGVLALFGSTTVASTGTLNSLCNTHKMPFFTWNHPYKYKFTNNLESNQQENEPSRHDVEFPYSHSSSHSSSSHINLDYSSSVEQFAQQMVDGRGGKHSSSAGDSTVVIDPSSVMAKSTQSGTFVDISEEIKSVEDLKKYNEMNSQSKNFQVHMHPDMVPMLISLIKYNRWQIIYYVYNHDEALSRLEGLFEYQMKEIDFVTSILVRKIEDISDCLSMLK